MQPCAPFIIKWGRGTYERLFVKREEPGYFFPNDSFVCLFWWGAIYISRVLDHALSKKKKKKHYGDVYVGPYLMKDEERKGEEK